MSAIIHITLLHETRQNPVCKAGEIPTKSKICLSAVERFLGELKEAGVITIADDEIHITSEQRMRIAELAILAGADSERVARELRWQEFEGLAARILDVGGYATAKHFIFRNSARKYEIDVLGAKEPMVLCVDCKHWHHGWAPSRIMTAARNQMMRVQCLSEGYAFYGRKLCIAGWPLARFLPIVLTLADVSSKLVDGVPIVSALRLRDFLCQVGPWDERLRFVDASVSSQALLVS